MTSIKKTSIALALILGSFITVSKAHADVIVAPGAPAYVDLLVVGGVAVAIVAVVAWLIIRVIRKRNVARQ